MPLMILPILFGAVVGLAASAVIGLAFIALGLLIYGLFKIIIDDAGTERHREYLVPLYKVNGNTLEFIEHQLVIREDTASKFARILLLNFTPHRNEFYYGETDYNIPFLAEVCALPRRFVLPPEVVKIKDNGIRELNSYSLW